MHADYLNNKMKTIKKRHPKLTHATPHKLRHTGATLAKKAGMSLEAISEALTHSDTLTTKTYVNTSNIVPLSAGHVAYQHLKMSSANLGQILGQTFVKAQKKAPVGKPCECFETLIYR